MSFVFGIALSHFALILADTRLNMTFKDGGKKTNDNKPLELTLPDGSILSYGIKNRKFLQCPNGFAAFAGHALWGNFVLKNIAHSDLSKLTDIKDKIGSCYQESKEIIASFIPESQDEIDRTAFLIINNSESETSIHSLNSKGDQMPLNGNFYFYFPPDIAREACAKYQKKLLDGFVGPKNLEDVLHDIKLIANIQNEISSSSQLVSSLGEIGFIMKEGDKTFMNKYIYIDTAQTDAFTKECLIKSIGIA